MKRNALEELRNDEIATIIDACGRYRNALSKAEKDMFDIGFSKLIRYRQEAELDSMEMIMITRALKAIYILYKQHDHELLNYAKAHQIINLAFYIDCHRVLHQKMHLPKLKQRSS